MENCLQTFPHINALREEQKTCLLDVVTILPTGFGKSLIFELFPGLMNELICSEAAEAGEDEMPMSTITVVSPLISVMRDQIQQLKQLGFSAAAIGISEECLEDEEKARNGECEIVFESPESWLSNTWIRELKDGKLGRQTVALALDEFYSVTEWYVKIFVSKSNRFCIIIIENLSCRCETRINKNMTATKVSDPDVNEE